jgi:hypothetical protein
LLSAVTVGQVLSPPNVSCFGLALGQTIQSFIECDDVEILTFNGDVCADE